MFIELSSQSPVSVDNGRGVRSDSQRITQSGIDDTTRAIHAVMYGTGISNTTKLRLINRLMDRPILHQSDKPYDRRRRAGSLSSAFADVICDHIMRIDLSGHLDTQVASLMMEFARKSNYYRINWRSHQDNTSLPLADLCAQSLADIRAQNHGSALLTAQTPRTLVSIHDQTVTNDAPITLEYFVATAGGLRIAIQPESTVTYDTGCLEITDASLSIATLSSNREVLLSEAVQALESARSFLERMPVIEEVLFNGSIAIDSETGQVVNLHLNEKTSDV